ncbi:hypothetical protein F442_15218 [Phytophthora nicotianae P10297]|uniref:PiggyBac transposable element-derived protein 4 C-terminal zinc-ribbon domain-containing protein n=1 Tax=Phytophthora nicotianae P10297 TaxID=1317064 RepID=W2YQ07_PHYNI|nr:hypothetical protein F442_15218 [Phytophthora nicotianae P10297]
MGLIDVAIVNAYIVFREAQKRFDARPISHAEFLLKLHANMLDLDERSFTDQAPPTDIDSEAFAPMVGHEAQESPDYQIVNGVRKRRQRQCKVCSLLKRRIGKRRATKYYCPTCSPSEKARTYLFQKVWKHFPGNTMTCSQIWHYKWENGTKRPAPRCGRDIQSRAADGGGGAKAAGQRKRRRLVKESNSEDEEDAEGQIEGELDEEDLEEE